ncbi:hypothetical protein BJ742DRAFT_22183 [Cladochytrium replicatum]|nr:hypothetical protein BJ742DRAFT_22183 [Cladochytrium replicatum]
MFETSVLITAHKKGSIKLWHVKFQDSKLQESTLELKRSIEQHTNPSMIVYAQYFNSHQLLITGDMSGRVYSWAFSDGSSSTIHFSFLETCNSCNMKFTVIDRRYNCRCCGGAFCGPCIGTLIETSAMCIMCKSKQMMHK